MTQTTHEERLEVYKEASLIFGEETQLVVALEELSEIQTEICKALRGFVPPAQLAEEVADATIILEQLRYIFGIGKAVDMMVDIKISHLAQRIEEAKE